MTARKDGGYRAASGGRAPSSDEYVQAFKDAVQGNRERVRQTQELRRSSAASPVKRDRPRSEDKRRDIADSSE